MAIRYLSRLKTGNRTWAESAIAGAGCRNHSTAAAIALTIPGGSAEIHGRMPDELSESPSARGGGPAARLLEYTLPGGWTVLAGRTEADNDRLSLKLAKANDYWFHVRGMPGSHVVLRCDRDE